MVKVCVWSLRFLFRSLAYNIVSMYVKGSGAAQHSKYITNYGGREL